MEDKVENFPDQREIGNEEISISKKKGGLVTIPFIIGNEALEKVSSYGLVSNIIFYLTKDYHMSVANSTNVINLWSAATAFTPLLGAFLADSYLGRFLTIGYGSITCLLGTILLWLTAMVPKSKPPPCTLYSPSCKSSTAAQRTHLFFAFALISIGAGGVRPCSIAFGADQLERRDNSKQGILESFFGWYYASSFFAVIVAVTGLVYIQDHLGWKVGLGIPAILVCLAVIMFFVASPLYLKKKPNKRLFTGLAQVIVAAYRNRNVSFPSPNSTKGYHHIKDSKIAMPTAKLRFLNKSCVIVNRDQDIAADGLAVNPWKLCTIEQVEELKALIKVLPLWSTGIMLSISAAQTPFIIIQANSMDRRFSNSFEIPAASFTMFGLIIMVIWVILYDRVILPLASKMKGKEVQLGVKLRMGIGLFFSWLGMVVLAILENVRRGEAIREGMEMSAMWLILPFCMLGLAEAFTAIGQTEFFYTELPKSMSSIAAALFTLGGAIANLLATVIVSAVKNLTARGGKESWLSNDVNKGRYDCYYWVLAALSFINLLYFIFCSWTYGPCGEEITKVSDSRNGFREEETSSAPGGATIRLKNEEK